MTPIRNMRWMSICKVYAESNPVAHSQSLPVRSMGGMATTLPTSGPIETSVYPSISYEEFGRLLRKYGYAAEALIDRNRLGYRTLAEPCFRAWMQTPFRGRPDEFASVFLHGRVRLPFEVTAATLHDINWKMMVAHVAANGRGNLVASHTLVVCGGITE